jgi:hypothetical protein
MVLSGPVLRVCVVCASRVAQNTAERSHVLTVVAVKMPSFWNIAPEK